MSCLFISIGRLLNKSPDDVRSEVCDFMAHNLETEFQGMQIADWIKWQTNATTPAEYIAMMRKPSTWGGAMEIAMCTKLYRVDIHVYSASLIQKKRLAEFVWDESRTACVQLHISWTGAHFEPMRVYKLVE
jgi:hypothetical protein